MAVEIKRGFEALENYAEVAGDVEKKERVRQQAEQVFMFLDLEGLLDISRKEIVEIQRRKAREKYLRYQSHLAAVTQESLRVSEGKFVHTSQASVVKNLRTFAEIEQDPRLIPTYTDSGLKDQIWAAFRILAHGSFPCNEAKENWIKLPNNLPLTTIIDSERFNRIIPSWQQTLRYAAEILPEGTTLGETGFLLPLPLNLKVNYRKSVSIEERLEAVREHLT